MCSTPRRPAPARIPTRGAQPRLRAPSDGSPTRALEALAARSVGVWPAYNTPRWGSFERLRALFDRKAGRDDTVFEDAAAAVGRAPLAYKTLMDVGHRLGNDAGRGRDVLDKVVAKAALGDINRRQSARLRHAVERVRHRPNCRVDREIGPVVGQATARVEQIETAPPEPLVAFRRPRGIVKIDQHNVEASWSRGDILLGRLEDHGIGQIEPAPRDGWYDLVGVDQSRRAIGQVGAHEAPHR